MPVNQPYVFGCWYGYNQDCTPVGPAFYMTNTSVVSTASAAYSCNYIFDGSYYANIYYHDGTGATPVVGDTVYRDAGGDNEYNPATNRFVGNSITSISGGTGLYRFDAGSGEVKQVYTCRLNSFSSSTNNTSSNVCSATINQTYYHNGSASTPVAGDTTYSSNSNTYPYLSAGNYKISSTQYITVGSNGLVSSLNTCRTDFQSSGDTSLPGVCLAIINLTYSHNGSGTFPTAGDSVFDENGDPVVSGYYKFNGCFVFKTTLNVVDSGWPQGTCC